MIDKSVLKLDYKIVLKFSEDLAYLISYHFRPLHRVIFAMTTNSDKPQKILLLWGPYVKQDHLVKCVEHLKKDAGANGQVAVENLDRVLVCKPFCFTPVLL